MTKLARPLSGANLGPSPRINAEPLVGGRQDLRRSAGKELAWFQQALGHRDEFPLNIWMLGDSMTENFGVTDDYHSWVDLFRSAIQNRYRNGGPGYIPSRRAQGITWPYTANPDGKNLFALTSGALVDNVDYGLGFGRKSTWMNTSAVETITVDCDRFWIHYTSGGTVGNITVDVDPGTPFAFSTTVSTTNAFGLSGRIFDSFTAFGTLALGTHVVRITAATATVFLDGITVFYTDSNVGVHVWNGGHSGLLASHFNASDNLTSQWPDMAYQPYTPTNFTDGVGNGTTTFTSATAAFTDLDIGSYIVFGADTSQSCTNAVARVVARASGTSVTLDRVVVSGTGKPFQLNRAQVTDAVLTSGSKTMTSATAAFNPWDVGIYVTGPTGMPAGTYIARWNSATSVELSNAATASQSAQTVRFMGRQAVWCAPDLMVVEFGINDMNVGQTTAAYKANIRAMVSHASERSAIGYPVGYPRRYTPSVVLLGMWAPGTQGMHIAVGDLTTTSGSAVVTSETIDFDQTDVGKTITTPSNTPIPAGTTIASVQSNRQATLSANAVASTSAGVPTIVNRTQLDKFWQRFRTALFELATENTWRFFDLYSLGGFIGLTDPLNLTYDGTHPNNHGAKWIADELDILVTGQPRSGPIPVGIFDARGDIPVGSAADTADKLAVGIDGQGLKAASASNVYGKQLGLVWADDLMKSRVHYEIAQVGLTVFTNVGWTTAPGDVGTSPVLANADSALGAFVRRQTKVSTPASGDAAGRKTSSFTLIDPRWIPEFAAEIVIDSTIANSRIWVGFFSAAPEGSSNPSASLAAFRYDTGIDNAGLWSTATKDGTTINTNNGGKTPNIAIATSTRYELRIAFVGVKGSNPTGVQFWINDRLAATHTANLPANTKTLGAQISITTLTSAQRLIDIGRWSVSH